MNTKKLVVTGTQAYGPMTPDSDFDIVLRKRHAKVLREMLDVLGIIVRDSSHIHPSYEGFYFKFNSHPKVQIIVAASEEEFDSWEKTTNDLRKMSPIPERNNRIDTFRQFFYANLSNRYKQNMQVHKIF
jgi:hypothetical protein